MNQIHIQPIIDLDSQNRHVWRCLKFSIKSYNRLTEFLKQISVKVSLILKKNTENLNFKRKLLQKDMMKKYQPFEQTVIHIHTVCGSYFR